MGIIEKYVSLAVPFAGMGPGAVETLVGDELDRLWWRMTPQQRNEAQNATRKVLGYPEWEWRTPVENVQ